VNPLPLVAVAGSPNAGKSALFNALTGARQKVGNYPGVTVERHSGRLTLEDGRPVEMVNLPGAYSLEPASPDEAVTRDVLLGTRRGMAIRFEETDMRPIGRAAMGVKSIELDDDDVVVAMSIVEDGAQVLSITELGYGKRTEIDEYRVQSRGGKGIKAMNLTEKTGLLAGQLLVSEDEDMLIITDDGTVIRTPVSAVSTLGRNTQGVRIMRVQENCKVVCVARAEAEEEDEGDNCSCADSGEE
jgi:DNA gyrase/topoisomerase IV subunit A